MHQGFFFGGLNGMSSNNNVKNVVKYSQKWQKENLHSNPMINSYSFPLFPNFDIYILRGPYNMNENVKHAKFLIFKSD